MTFEDWRGKYKPIKNRFDTNASFDGEMFETFGAELAFVQVAEQNRVWTWTDDGGYSSITNGFGFVNRQGYFITEVAFEEDGFLDINLKD